jgi:PAT family beta-lactamase induction signal transducer AmpG
MRTEEARPEWGAFRKSLTSSPLLRFLFFGALYLAQGIPWGFITVGYVVFLSDLGMNNEAVGSAVGLAYLPWSFKLAWGPLLDLYRGGVMGRRRPFIVLAELGMGATLLALMLCDPRRQLGAVSALIFLHNTFAGLQDVAVDGLAVDVLPENERGRANSIMWACKVAGVAVGGSGGTLLAKYAGWPALYVAMAVMLWLIMLLPLLVRERPSVMRAGEGRPGLAQLLRYLRELWRSFAPAPNHFGLLIALLTPAGYALVGAFTTRMYRVELHLDADRIAALTALDPIAGVAGAMAGGFVADRLRARRTMGLFMVAIGATIAAFAALHAQWTHFSLLVGYSIVLSFVIAAYSVASLSFFMTLSNPAIGATQFTAYMAMTNFCYSRTAPLGGWMADHQGYVAAYLIAAVVQVVTIPLLLLSDPKQAEAQFRRGKDDKGALPASEPV